MLKAITFFLILILVSCNEENSVQAVTNTTDSLQQEAQESAGIRRKDEGCKDPHFIEAEEQAYRDLLDDEEVIAGIKKQNIDEMETVMKTAFDSLDIVYNKALNQCGNNNACTEKAMQDKEEARVALGQQKDEWKKRLDISEALDIEEAHKVYDAAVEKALNLFCRNFAASGACEDVTFSGQIACLSKNFIITGHSKSLGNDFDINCAPDTDSAGTYKWAFAYSVVKATGTGNYNINGLSTGHPVLMLEGFNSFSAPGGHSSRSGAVAIALTNE